jgi:hypothetical protein
LWLVPGEPDPLGGDQEQGELLARLRAVAEAKDAEVSLLRAELAAERELRSGWNFRSLSCSAARSCGCGSPQPSVGVTGRTI